MTFELFDPPIIATTMFREVRGLGTGFPKLTLQLANMPAIGTAVLCQVGRLSTCVNQWSPELRNLELAKGRVRIPLKSLVVFSAQFAFPGRGRSIARPWGEFEESARFVGIVPSGPYRARH